MCSHANAGNAHTLEFSDRDDDVEEYEEVTGFSDAEELEGFINEADVSHSRKAMLTFKDMEANDMAALEAFMSNRLPERRTLADIIMEKMKAVQESQEAEAEAAASAAQYIPKGLNEKVVEVYSKYACIPITSLTLGSESSCRATNRANCPRPSRLSRRSQTGRRLCI
jgi:hypothetical protein